MASMNILEFRDFNSADLAVIALAMGDAKITQFYGLETKHTEAHAIANEQLSWFHELADSGDGWWQAICLEGQVIGAIGVYEHDDDGDSAELGYWLLPSHWGRAVMRHALAQWLPLAFQRLKLNSVVAYVEPENLASIKLLTAAGFTHEGLLRECAKRGQHYVSLERFSLLARELKTT